MLGACSRYGIGLLITNYCDKTWQTFPWPTLLVNILGSFLIALFFELAKGNNWPSSWVLFLTTGLLGGFTTFSSFSWESLSFILSGNYLFFALNVVANLLLSLLGVSGGFFLGRLF